MKIVPSRDPLRGCSDEGREIGPGGGIIIGKPYGIICPLVLARKRLRAASKVALPDDFADQPSSAALVRDSGAFSDGENAEKGD